MGFKVFKHVNDSLQHQNNAPLFFISIAVKRTFRTKHSLRHLSATQSHKWTFILKECIQAMEKAATE